MNRDELFARAALAAQRRRDRHVLNLGPVRPSVTSGSPRVALAGTDADLHHREASAGPGLTDGGPGLGGAQAQRAGAATERSQAA